MRRINGKGIFWQIISEQPNERFIGNCRLLESIEMIHKSWKITLNIGQKCRCGVIILYMDEFEENYVRIMFYLQDF